MGTEEGLHLLGVVVDRRAVRWRVVGVVACDRRLLVLLRKVMSAQYQVIFKSKLTSGVAKTLENPPAE